MSDAGFRFRIGQKVHWAAQPGTLYQVAWRRWTERMLFGPVVEYRLCPLAQTLDTWPVLYWAAEADITPVEETP